MKVAVSFLGQKNTREIIKLIDNSAADFIHVDICDGKYVPKNNCQLVSPDMLKNTLKPLDFHLMMENPSDYIKKLKNLNISCITIHPKTTNNFKTLVNEIHQMASKVGIAINPDEDVSLFSSYLVDVDQVLIMSVYPGEGGQKFISTVTKKIAELRKINPHLIIGVDGGINRETINLVKDADYVVAGSYIWQEADYNGQINSLK